MEDQVKRRLQAALPAACVGVYTVLAPVPTVTMTAVNAVVKYNAHKGLSGGRRIAVVALMNAVLCASMGMVSTLYASLPCWMLAAASFTWLFGGEPRSKKKRRRLKGSKKRPAVFGRMRYDDVIDVTPLHDPEAVETRR